MNLNQMFPSAKVRAEDLQQAFPVGTVVTVERVEPRQDREGETYFIIQFKELSKPCNLNKTNAHAIAEIAGTYETDEWPGTLVKIISVPVEIPGDNGAKKLVQAIRCFRPKPNDRPTLQAKTDLGFYLEAQRRESTRREPSKLDAASAGSRIGEEDALKIAFALERRGKSIEDARQAIIRANMGDLIASKMPPDWPSNIKAPVNTFLRSLPMTRDVVEDRRGPELLAAWKQPQKAAGDVIDPVTGEVIPQDDIPF